MLAADRVLQERYRVVGRIGQGGMGAIYEAQDLRLGHSVALKQLLGSGEALPQAFEREARMLARLRHPALPRVTDYFTEGDYYFLVMEHIRGDDLGAMLRGRVEPFPVAAVVAWGDQLLDALEYLHRQEPPVVHRDIKPANIKLLPDGHVVLLDFGLSKGGIADQTRVGEWSSFYGFSPQYAPLEQIDGVGTEPRSDLYALGATLYHLLTASELPTAIARAHAGLEQQPDPLRPAHELNPRVPPSLSALLTSAMALHPSGRPASAAEMRQALSRVETGTPFTVIGDTTLALPEAIPAARPAPAALRRLAKILVVFVVLLLLGSALTRQILRGAAGGNGAPTPTVSAGTDEPVPPLIGVAGTLSPTPTPTREESTSTATRERPATVERGGAITVTLTVEPSPTPTETPEPAPEPTSPAPPPPTPRVPTATARIIVLSPTPPPPVISPTRQPPSPTPTLSLTSSPEPPQPTPSPTPPVLGENCAIKPADLFFGVWQSYRSQIGCPTSAALTLPSHCERRFEGGTMLWRGDADQVYVIYDRDLASGEDITAGAWLTDPAWQWDGSDPDGVGMEPPPGYYEPTRGFGWVWRTIFSGPNGPLGWSIEPDENCQANTALVQQFERGRMVRGISAAIYFLLDDSTFIRR